MSAHRFLHLLYIGILADIGHGVQQALYREPIIRADAIDGAVVDLWARAMKGSELAKRSLEQQRERPPILRG